MISILNIKTNSPEDVQDLDTQMTLIWDLITTKFGTLTAPEIREAMKMYVAKEFEGIRVFRLLDCISIAEILTAYMNFRNDSLRVYIDNKMQKKLELPEQTESEKLRIVNNGIIRRYSEYMASGTIDEPFSHIFDTLIERGIIKGSTTPKLEKYYQDQLELASKEVEFETRKKLFNADKLERTRINQEIEDIITGVSSKIEVRAKRNILKHFFDTQIARNVDFEKLIINQ